MQHDTDVLDIVGDGISGFFITGRDVADIVVTQTIKHIKSAKKNAPELYDQPALTKYLKDIKEIHNNTPPESNQSSKIK